MGKWAGVGVCASSVRPRARPDKFASLNGRDLEPPSRTQAPGHDRGKVKGADPQVSGLESHWSGGAHSLNPSSAARRRPMRKDGAPLSMSNCRGTKGAHDGM